MNDGIPERDWKYLRSLKDEMLAELCGRINRESVEVLRREGRSEHEKYLALAQKLTEELKGG